jgi:hypothetical protein
MFLNDYQTLFFNFFIVITYMLLFLSALGLYPKAKDYLSITNEIIRVYICLFLLYRFHPFQSAKPFTTLDRRIAFSAGLFILTTTILNKYITPFTTKSQ